MIDTTTLRTFTATPQDIQINVPCLVMYFDAEMNDMDGNGWCIELYPGSSTFRYSTYAEAVEAMASGHYFWEKMMLVRAV